jgi:hypothetical protein
MGSAPKNKQNGKIVHLHPKQSGELSQMTHSKIDKKNSAIVIDSLCNDARASLDLAADVCVDTPKRFLQANYGFAKTEIVRLFGDTENLIKDLIITAKDSLNLYEERINMIKNPGDLDKIFFQGGAQFFKQVMALPEYKILVQSIKDIMTGWGKIQSSDSSASQLGSNLNIAKQFIELIFLSMSVVEQTRNLIDTIQMKFGSQGSAVSHKKHKKAA